MSDDRPSIAELQRLHGDIDRDEDGTTVCVECSEPFFIREGREPGTVCDSCAQHVVSTVLPVLLEIAAAARAFRDARCDTQTHAWDEAERDDRLCFGAIHCESCPVDVALERLRAAAGKVMP